MTAVPKKSHKTHHALQQQPSTSIEPSHSDEYWLISIVFGLLSVMAMSFFVLSIWKIWMWIGKQRGKAFARGWQESMRR